MDAKTPPDVRLAMGTEAAPVTEMYAQVSPAVACKAAGTGVGCGTSSHDAPGVSPLYTVMPLLQFPSVHSVTPSSGGLSPTWFVFHTLLVNVPMRSHVYDFLKTKTISLGRNGTFALSPIRSTP